MASVSSIIIALEIGEFPRLAADLRDTIAALELDVQFLVGGHHALPDVPAPVANLASELGRTSCAAP